MESDLKLICGLGNPGMQYENTRHNAGFMILDELARRDGIGFEKSMRWQAVTAKAPGGVIYCKPQTFMNHSGRAVSAIARYFKMSPEQVLVIYDDTAFDLGTIKFKAKGSAGGHNGIKSLIQHFGSEEFPRLKFGIGVARSNHLVGHVLGKFSQEEGQLLQNTLATACDAVQFARSRGFSAAANEFNTRKKDHPSNIQEDEQKI